MNAAIRSHRPADDAARIVYVSGFASRIIRGEGAEILHHAILPEKSGVAVRRRSHISHDLIGIVDAVSLAFNIVGNQGLDAAGTGGNESVRREVRSLGHKRSDHGVGLVYRIASAVVVAGRRPDIDDNIIAAADAELDHAGSAVRA